MTDREYTGELSERIEKAIEWMRSKGWHRVEAKRGTPARPLHVQTLFDHTLNLLEVLAGLAPFLVGKWGGRADFSIEEFDTLFVAVLGHDVGKGTEPWQLYVKGLGDWVSHIRPELVNEIVAEWLEPDQGADASIVVQRHHAGGKQLEAEHLAGVLTGKHHRRHVDLARLLRQIDHVASAPTLREARRAIEEGVDRPLADIVTTAVHQIVVRGVTTTLLHRAALDAFVDAGWRPVLHFPEGTLYVAHKPDTPAPPAEQDIRQGLERLIDQVLTEAHFPRQVVGRRFTETVIAKPELFDAVEFRQYLEEALTRATAAGFRRKDTAERIRVVTKYRKLTPFWDSDLPDILSEPGPEDGVGNFAAAVTYAAVIERMTDRIAEAQPEICAFKFFRDAVGTRKKKLMASDRINLPSAVAPKDRRKLQGEITRRIDSFIEWVFQGFGDGAYAALKKTGSLKVAEDMANSVDWFWRVDAEAMGIPAPTGATVRDAHRPEKRREVLVEVLDRIAQAAWGSLPPECVPRRISAMTMAEKILADLIQPALAPANPADARRALEAYSVSKQTARKEEGPHVCPLCNADFAEGQVAKADFLNKATAFTNRVPALARGGGGVVICDACRFDRFVEQLLLGKKSAAMLALYPRGQVGAQRGALLVSTAQKLLAEWSKYMTPETPDPERHVSLALTRSIAVQLDLPSSLEGIDAASIAELFLYENADDKRTAHRRDLKKEVSGLAGKGLAEWNQFWDQAFGSEEAFVNAVLAGEQWVRDDSELTRIRAEVCGVRVDARLVAQTPHLVLLLLPAVLRDKSPFAVGKDSEVNAAIRALFAMLVLGRALDCAVALVEDGRPWEPDMVRGVVKVPDNPALRKLVASEWITLENAERWLQAIAAASQLAPATAFPERSDLYQILTAPTAGHIVRRIDMNEDSGGYQLRHADLVHRIAPVLEFAGIRYVPDAAS
jgi:hypothetical protein